MIEEAMPRFDKLSAAFKDDPEFLQIMAHFYEDILEFHRRAYKFFRKRGKHRISCSPHALLKHLSYNDERHPDGKFKGMALDGPAHGDFYAQLAKSTEGVPWHATFVKDKGYVSFK